MLISRSVILKMRNGSEKKVVDEVKTHILFSIFFFRKPYRLWDDAEKYGTSRQATDENTVRLMRFKCWMYKATNTS